MLTHLDGHLEDLGRRTVTTDGPVTGRCEELPHELCRSVPVQSKPRDKNLVT